MAFYPKQSFAEPGKVKNKNPFMPSKSAQMQKNITKGFSESVKMAATVKILPNTWRDSAPPGMNVKSFMSSTKKNRRPPWDMKGRLQDQQVLNYELNEKVGAMALNEINLLEGNAQLRNKSKNCDDDVEKYNKRIEELQQKLSKKTNELNLAKKEKDEVLFAAHCHHLDFVKENSLRKSNLALLEMQRNELVRLHMEIQPKTVTTKISLSEVQSELKLKHMELENVLNENKVQKQTYEIRMRENKKLRNKVKAMQRSK